MHVMTALEICLNGLGYTPFSPASGGVRAYVGLIQLTAWFENAGRARTPAIRAHVLSWRSQWVHHGLLNVGRSLLEIASDPKINGDARREGLPIRTALSKASLVVYDLVCLIAQERFASYPSTVTVDGVSQTVFPDLRGFSFIGKELKNPRVLALILVAGAAIGALVYANRCYMKAESKYQDLRGSVSLAKVIKEAEEQKASNLEETLARTREKVKSNEETFVKLGEELETERRTHSDSKRTTSLLQRRYQRSSVGKEQAIDENANLSRERKDLEERLSSLRSELTGLQRKAAELNCQRRFSTRFN